MSATEKPLRADARRNQAKLIEIAREVFTAGGVEAPLDDIARRAEVGPGTLYRHFPTREDLLAAVYRDDVLALCADAAALAGRLSPEEALAEWTRHLLDYIKRKHGIGAAVKKMLGTEAPTLVFCRDSMRAALGDLLARAKAAGAVRADVEPATVLRLVHGIGVASENAPEEAELLLDIMLAGLRPATTPPSTSQTDRVDVARDGS